MNTNELRIGNFISGQNDPPMRVVSISTGGVDLRFDGVDEDYGDWSYDDDELHPIDLTPEILEKCGFEKMNEIECYSILTETGEIIISFDYVLQSTDTLTKLKYLHQLQNLYFALTGEELKINLSEHESNEEFKVTNVQLPPGTSFDGNIVTI